MKVLRHGCEVTERTSIAYQAFTGTNISVEKYMIRMKSTGTLPLILYNIVWNEQGIC